MIIEKDHKEIALLIPKKTKTDWKRHYKTLKEAKGILKEYSPEEIAPARDHNAWRNFREWDTNSKLRTK